MNGIMNLKSRQFSNLNSKFQSLYEKVMQQLSLSEDLVHNGTKIGIFEKIIENESAIDMLENEIRIEVINILLISTPRAVELRKLITYQDITNFLEEIGDLVIDLSVYYQKKIDLSLADFEYFRLTLGGMLSLSKKMVEKAVIAFCCENANDAYETISDDDAIDKLFGEISENIVLTFQDLQLNDQEITNIVNISNIAYIIEHIGDIATHIAEAAIYLIEGKDIRHRLSKKNKTI
jgi:phosphate transport system protein